MITTLLLSPPPVLDPEADFADDVPEFHLEGWTDNYCTGPITHDSPWGYPADQEPPF